MSFAATCMVWEIIILSELTQRKTNLTGCHLHAEPKIWHKWTYLKSRNRLTDIENRLTVSQWERGGGRSIN